MSSTTRHAPPATDLAPAEKHPAQSFGRILTNRIVGQPAWVVVTEAFIGLGWMRAAVSKIIDPSWWSGDYLAHFLADHDTEMLGWYAPFADRLVSSNLAATAFIVPVLQLGVALSLLAGKGRAIALGFAMAMNLHFVAVGAVNPSAFYLLAQGALLLWMVDRWSADSRRAVLPTVAATGLAVAGFNLPFIATLHPAEVIDDPAIMMITVGGLACLASIVALTADAQREW